MSARRLAAILQAVRTGLRSPTLLIGSVILLFWIACALFGSRMTPLDPYADDLLATLTPPSPSHWFGTDQLGRDIFSRVIIGARDILIVAPLATLLGSVMGTVLGLVIGYFARSARRYRQPRDRSAAGTALGHRGAHGAGGGGHFECHRGAA